MQRTLAGGNSGPRDEEGYLARGTMWDAHLLLGKREGGAMGPLLGAFPLPSPVLGTGCDTQVGLLAVGISSLLLPMACLRLRVEVGKLTCSSIRVGLTPLWSHSVQGKSHPDFPGLNYSGVLQLQGEKVGQLASGLGSAYSRNTSQSMLSSIFQNGGYPGIFRKLSLFWPSEFYIHSLHLLT